MNKNENNTNSENIDNEKITKPMYYYVILNKDSSYIGYFIYLANLRNKETNKFFDNSILMSIDLDYENGHKMLFCLKDEKIYYEKQFEYFNKFRKMCNGCIKSFNYIGNDLDEFYKNND